jgi:hypothetical protein
LYSASRIDPPQFSPEQGIAKAALDPNRGMPPLPVPNADLGLNLDGTTLQNLKGTFERPAAKNALNLQDGAIATQNTIHAEALGVKPPETPFNRVSVHIFHVVKNEIIRPGHRKKTIRIESREII